jgi:hypothetical protein
MLENAKATGRLRAPKMVAISGDPEQFLTSPRVGCIRDHRYNARDDETTDAFHDRLNALRWPGEEMPVIVIGPEKWDDSPPPANLRFIQ